MTPRALADQMGVTPKTAYDWINDRTVVSEDRIPLLAEALGLSVIETRRGLGYWVPDAAEPASKWTPKQRALLEEAARTNARLTEIVTELLKDLRSGK